MCITVLLTHISTDHINFPIMYNYNAKLKKMLWVSLKLIIHITLNDKL